MSRRKNTTLSVGSQLKSARAKRGHSSEEVATILHIPLSQIQALEADESARVFSAPVYAHGALRTYATWLGLDARALERMLAVQLREAHANRSQLKVHTLPRWYQWLFNPRVVIALAGLALAGVIGSYVFWQIQSFWRLPELVITSPETTYIDADQVRVAGSVESGAKLRLNGEQVILREGVFFDETLALDPGVTIIRFEVENVAGRSLVVDKHLLRPRNPGTLK
jgi:hypothetical protein